MLLVVKKVICRNRRMTHQKKTKSLPKIIAVVEAPFKASLVESHVSRYKETELVVRHSLVKLLLKSKA